MAVIGLDIGGTKLAAAHVDADGTLLRIAHRPTPTTDVWNSCVTVLREVAAGVHVGAVGIACAGPIDLRAGTVSPLNIADWSRFPLLDAVSEEFPDAHVRLDGDGTCMAVAEYRFGAGRGVPDLLGVVASTESVAGWFSTAGRSAGVAATPDTSGTWWWSRVGRRVRAAGWVASRRWPAVRRRYGGRANEAGKVLTLSRWRRLPALMSRLRGARWPGPVRDWGRRSLPRRRWST